MQTIKAARIWTALFVPLTVFRRGYVGKNVVQTLHYKGYFDDTRHHDRTRETL
jgi:hypothetical protein